MNEFFWNKRFFLLSPGLIANNDNNNNVQVGIFSM